MPMYSLTDRQQTLLMLVVRDYIETALPVGSQRMTQRYHLDVSSATIRNEMQALTEMGYLRQPHTSAGRVPTEAGYRFFASNLMHQAELPEATQHTISHQFYQARPEIDQWMNLAASVLAHQSQGASMVTAPHAEQARFKHLELISTQGRQVLMVLVIAGGEVRQQILSLAEPVGQERLSMVANRLNQLMMGRTAEECANLPLPADALEYDVMTLVQSDLRELGQRIAGQIYVDGLSNVLAEPEFGGSEDARKTLKLLEERTSLQELLSRTALGANVGGVQVIVGGEGDWYELRHCSMVMARYGVPGLVTGMLGVLGPMRMPYAQNIPTVRYVAELLSTLVNDTMGDQSEMA
jgi:heat-inducible transcriptional repressor